MRIISGKYGGRRLVSFDAGHIRPTTDRVKETLFNKLMGRLEGERVLDLFSGTGSLAIECLSRGAEWVDLVENHKKSLGIIRENLELLKITAGFRLHPVDAFRYLETYSGPPYAVVIADPPFTRAWAHELAAKIGAGAVLAPGGIAVIEASSNERMDEAYPGLIRLDQRGFGDKHLNFFEKAGSEPHGQGDLPR